MTQANFFFTVFLTILTFVRVFLFFKPMHIPLVKGFQIRQYMIGISLILLGAIFEHVTLFGIGFALFIEEVPMLILKEKKRIENYSPKASLIILGLILVIFLFRRAIVFW
jgi:hypothetical protein